MWTMVMSLSDGFDIRLFDPLIGLPFGSMLMLHSGFSFSFISQPEPWNTIPQMNSDVIAGLLRIIKPTVSYEWNQWHYWHIVRWAKLTIWMSIKPRQTWRSWISISMHIKKARSATSALVAPNDIYRSKTCSPTLQNVQIGSFSNVRNFIES